MEHAMTPAAILPLVVHDLCYEIGGKRLLDHISFRTDAGPRTVVLGPNGAGKSLLLRLCHGLLQPSAGTIAWAGAAPDTARRCQAMVFQRPVLLRRSTAANITYVLRLQGIPRRQRRAMIDGSAGAGRVVATGGATGTRPVRWGAAAPRPGAGLGPQAPGVVP